MILAVYTIKAAVKLKPEKNLGLNRIQIHDLCSTSAFVYQLSYEANQELVTLWACNILIGGEEYKWII